MAWNQWNKSCVPLRPKSMKLNLVVLCRVEIDKKYSVFLYGLESINKYLVLLHGFEMNIKYQMLQYDLRLIPNTKCSCRVWKLITKILMRSKTSKLKFSVFISTTIRSKIQCHPLDIKNLNHKVTRGEFSQKV